jgi:hypothetical protein
MLEYQGVDTVLTFQQHRELVELPEFASQFGAIDREHT